MAFIQLDGVSKYFDTVAAVDNVTLQVESGEFVSLLGPSGCGKTTTIRLIAGFERPSHGRIFIAGHDVTHLPPYQRNLGVVFQNYALFPHMTVGENVAFGLKMRPGKRRELQAQVTEALALVHLGGLQQRYPRQLSGGQQQRVALARALVVRPSVLLLDEPLSNLDAKLRQEMRVELKQIQQQVGITTIFVTHDQDEALSLSDRVVVMHQGRIVQVGNPVQIYERPEHSFVAEFVGQANLLRGKVKDLTASYTQVELDDDICVWAKSRDGANPGRRVLVVVKHSQVNMGSDQRAASTNEFEAEVLFVNYTGSTLQYVCRVGPLTLAATVNNISGSPRYMKGDRVHVSWNPEDALMICE